MIRFRFAPRARSACALPLLAVALLAGCASAPADTPAQGSAATVTAKDWPRTIVHGDDLVEIPKAPQRVVALSTETSDIALQLVGHERVAAVSSGSASETAGNAVEEAEQVENVLPPGTTPDPEQVLSLEPDLVLMTGRHSGEEDTASVLAQTGVPSLVFDSAGFSTPDAVADSVRLIGEALGAEDEAESAAAALEEQVADVESSVADVDEEPRVLALMARGDKIMITGIGSTLNSLADLAGGAPVAEEQGWRGTLPADPEQIVVAAPDVILVEDFRGAGTAPFDSLLASDALAGVPAVADNRIHTVPSAIASGSAGLGLGDGLRAIAEHLHPELF